MKELIKSVVDVSKYIYERDLVFGKAGNISARFTGSNGEDVVAITPTLCSLHAIEEEDVVLVDIDGNPLTGGKPSSEIFMHLNIYKKRPDVNGIVHTHSPYATGFSFSANKKIKRLEGFGAINTPYFTELEYEEPGSDALATKTAETIGNEDVLILKNHGVVAVSTSVEEAGSLAEFVEEIAKTQFVTHMLNISK
ncbi:MAG: class II aldolase/adducin family protein [Methanobacteriaceae archaeon]